MARIRTIKPEFWQDEKLAPMPPLVRLVFLGLISMADDAGRLLDNVKAIDGFLFPESDDTCRDALETLAKASRILRYRSDSGQKLIQIVGWLKHQKIDHPNKHLLPAPPAEAVAAAADAPASAQSSRDSRETLAQSSRYDLGPVPATGDHRSTTTDHPHTSAPGAPPVLALVPVSSDRPVPATTAMQVAALREATTRVIESTNRREQTEERQRQAALVVFTYAASRLGYGSGTMFDQKRERRIVARLRENRLNVAELLCVVDGALKDDWIMGRAKDSPRPYTGIETVFRDRAQVERLAKLARYDGEDTHPYLEDVAALLTPHDEVANG